MTDDLAKEPLILHLKGRVTVADKAHSDYRLLPFSVPPGVSQLSVRYEYTDAISAAQTEEQGNVMDIGIFDPRGSERFHGEGFRGWSGSTRAGFSISPVAATPGYLPGPILPGKWEILLGLYRIAPQGCEYHITITLDRKNHEAHEGHAENAENLRDFHGSLSSEWSVQPGERRWYPGDLHMHTEHSDAKGSLADLVAVARARGLEYLAVTEHNTISHIPHLARYSAPDLLLIPGQEITTYYGHANAWGVKGWQEFRGRSNEDMVRICEAVHAAGGLFSINHPKQNGPPWEYDGLFAPADCLEVWQAPWFVGNHQSLALWDRLLREGHRLVAVGGSDRHQPPFTGSLGDREVGVPTTWVYAAGLSTQAILAGIRAGRVMVSADVQGPRLYLEADADSDGLYEVMMGDKIRAPAGSIVGWRCRVGRAAGHILRLVSSGAAWTLQVTGDDFTHTWEEKISRDTYYRAELIIPDEAETELTVLLRSALSNPIYVSVGVL